MSDLWDLDLFALPGMAAALATRDIAAIYRLLSRHGVAQRQIAAATGQSQSEVSEIRKGRQVQAYDVLVRICEGLGIPREAMGLSFGAYPDGTAIYEPGEADEDVLRRQFQHLLALAGVAAFGVTVPGVGELLNGSSSGGLPVDTPSRIGRADVETISALTRATADVARTQGGGAGPAVTLAQWADRCLTAQASDTARRALLVALSDLSCHRGVVLSRLRRTGSVAPSLRPGSGSRHPGRG